MLCWGWYEGLVGLLLVSMKMHLGDWNIRFESECYAGVGSATSVPLYLEVSEKPHGGLPLRLGHVPVDADALPVSVRQRLVVMDTHVRTRTHIRDELTHTTHIASTHHTHAHTRTHKHTPRRARWPCRGY